LSKTGPRSGQPLSGDIHVQRPGFRFLAPPGSSLVVSILLSLVLTLIAWFWRR
jgi:hypothetical protein